MSLLDSNSDTATNDYDGGFRPHRTPARNCLARHTVRIWSRATGRTLRIFHDAGALDGPGAIGGFSADGSRLLLSDPSGDLDVWQPCPACEDAPALLRLADQRSPCLRTLRLPPCAHGTNIRLNVA